MVSLSKVLKGIYRLVPPTFRKSWPVLAIRAFMYENVLNHDTIYSAHYYESTVEGPAVASAETISESILVDHGLGTVIDVGCGTGALLEALRNKGREVFGLESSAAALEYCKGRKLDVQKLDLEREPFPQDGKFDLVVSMEVAEHLPEQIADSYVDLLTRLSDRILFTAALPGQGGDDHVNEQPISYWMSNFQARRFSSDENLASRWSSAWRVTGVVASFYHANLMIFRRNQNTLP